jgi:hypothetical protein
MDRMQDGGNDKLGGLFAEYRESARGPGCKCAVHAEFVAAHRRAPRGHRPSVFRRLSQVFVVATAALTIFMAAVLIPRLQRDQVFSASYVEVLAADDHADYTDLLK